MHRLCYINSTRATLVHQINELQFVRIDIEIIYIVNSFTNFLFLLFIDFFFSLFWMGSTGSAGLCSLLAC